MRRRFGGLVEEAPALAKLREEGGILIVLPEPGRSDKPELEVAGFRLGIPETESPRSVRFLCAP